MGPSLLDRRLYSFGDVDAYLGLKAGTARRWIDGYRRRDRDYAPVIRERRTGDESVSWGEFVETRLLAGFRQRGATLQSLRPAIQRLREELHNPYPLATAKPYLDLLGKELVLSVQEASGVDPSVKLVVVRSGQLVLTPSVARFVDVVTFEDGLAQLLATDRVTPDVRFILAG